MDKSVRRLRELALKVREIASLPIQVKRRNEWRSLNDLKMIKPMVYIRDYPWEMVTLGDELTTTLADEFSARMEFRLLCTLFLWEHMRTDMVVEPVIECPVPIVNRTPILFKITSPGMAKPILTSRRSNFDLTAQRYIRQIFDESDIDRVIPRPHIEYNFRQQQHEWERASELFDGILEVRKTGALEIYCAPWDDLLKLFGFEEGMMEFRLRPRLMHRAIKRYMDVYQETLDQYVNAGLLQGNNCNTHVGSGGLGYTSDLPGKLRMGMHPEECWGFCTDQIFTSVSPVLHEEFAASYEAQWMDRFGLTYYGCCERLDHKIDILRQFRNLRKISVSPFSDLERAMEAIGPDYVVSFKPSSMLLAGTSWDPTESQKEILLACQLAKKYGCSLEIVMKTIISLHNKPQRIWQWCDMASRITASL